MVSEPARAIVMLFEPAPPDSSLTTNMRPSDTEAAAGNVIVLAAAVLVTATVSSFPASV
jgi:hypothetical protein